MKVIGLCGKSGSGKGLVCSIFDEYGIKSIDTDKVYHDIISYESDCTRELALYFGEHLHSNSGIDRKKLREVVFSSPEKLKNLNEITHKHILAKVREMIEEIKRAQNISGILIDAPLLFESGFDKECDLTVCVVADDNIAIERIMQRDNLSYEEASKRIKTQISNDVLINKCDYSIENNSTKEELRESIRDLINIIFDNN